MIPEKIKAQKSREGVIHGWFGSYDLALSAGTEQASVAKLDARFSLSSLPGWKLTEAVLDSGRFRPRAGDWVSDVLPVDLGIFSLDDEDHLAALLWLAELFEDTYAASGGSTPIASEALPPVPENFYCQAGCAGGRPWVSGTASDSPLRLPAYENWRTLFTRCAPEDPHRGEGWPTIAELHSRLNSPWSRRAGRLCARTFESYRNGFRRAAANIAVPGVDYLHLLLTWLGIVMSYRVTLSELARREKVAAEQAGGTAPESIPLTPKVHQRTTHGAPETIGVDSYKHIPGLMLGWWNVVGTDGMPETEQRARLYLCLTSMADYGKSYQRLGLDSGLELPEDLHFDTIGHSAWRHTVGNHGICFQREMDSIAGSAPYQIVDACFPGWLSEYPARVRLAAMVSMGYSNYGVWAFPDPKDLREMLYGAWNMMLSVLAASLTDLDAEAAIFETGTLCRGLPPQAASRLVGHLPEYLPLGPENDDATDRMLLSGMGYCWWGERGNVYARVQRLAAYLNGRPVPDTPTLSEWNQSQATTAAAVRSRTAAGRALIEHSRSLHTTGTSDAAERATTCMCSERLDDELTYVLHGLDRRSAGKDSAGTLTDALDKEVLLWHATPSLRSEMIANTPNTRVAIRRLLGAVMQPGAAQDLMLRAFCEGHVTCQRTTELGPK
ncbi:hypothetical protein [Streptomyces sp. NPDC002520]